MIKITGIHLQPGDLHTQADGSNIGGVPPVAYSAVLVPGEKPKLFLQTQGNTGGAGDYPAFMWYPAKAQPLLPTDGNISMQFKQRFGGDLSGLNVAETDVIVCKAGKKYDASVQRKNQGGYMIVDAKGEWQFIGADPGLIALNKTDQVKFDYFFDFEKGTTSVRSVTLNGGIFVVPSNMQGIAAQPTNWPDGVYVQDQLGSMPNGNGWNMLMYAHDLIF